jgi:nucleotide-binding universal stress UspA family protein
MKTILYATDCNPKSVPALQYAEQLSAELNTELIVLYVYDVPPTSGRIIKSKKQIGFSLKREKTAFMTNYCEQNLLGVIDRNKVRFVAQYNTSVSEAIIDISKRVNADLLLIGMKDEHTQRGLFSGNIANSLLEKVTCKLLIVPNIIQYKKLSSIVYASDFEENDGKAISQLVDSASAYAATIKIVHINTPVHKKSKEQMEWFKKIIKRTVNYPSITYSVIESDSVSQGLRRFIGDEHADIVAMLERTEKGFFKKLFHKDTVKTIESQIKIPLLAINNAQL